MNGSATIAAVEARMEPLRRRRLVAGAGAALGAAALMLGLGAAVARLGLVETAWWVFVAYAGAVVAVAAVVLGWRSRVAALATAPAVQVMEAAGAWRRGALTAFLDAPQGGASAALFAAADARTAADVATRGGAALAALGARIAREAQVAGMLVAGGGALLVTSSHGPAGGLLFRPGRAWDLARAAVRVEASAPSVRRGQPVTLTLAAPGRRRATLWLRAPGEGWRSVAIALDSLGAAAWQSPPLEADLFAHLEAGGRGSDTVHVAVRLPAFLAGVTITAHYPAYLHLDDEPMPTGGDTLVIPAGTRLDLQGGATVPLASAVITSGGATPLATLEATRERFRGSVTPVATAELRLEVRTADGAPLEGEMPRLPVRVLPDRPPVVAIPIPGADTVAPLGLVVPLVIDVQDDHGLSGVVLESRRISRIGVVEAPVREAVALPPGGADRGILAHTLDLSRRGLLPGDTVRYVAIATDNSPARQQGRSREFVMRLVTLTEVRAQERQQMQGALQQLDSLTRAARQLERQTEDLARERPRAAGAQQGQTGEALRFDEAKRAQAVADQQQKLQAQAERLREQLDQVQRSAEAAGLADSAFRAQLDEVREQLNRALTPELRQKLAELQGALKQLDAERVKDAMKELAEAQKRLREALEQSKELFRRAAAEGDLKNLTEEARELKDEQRRLDREAAGADSARAGTPPPEGAARDSAGARTPQGDKADTGEKGEKGEPSPAQQAAQQQLATRADSLGAALEKLGDRLKADGRQAAMQQAARRAKDAAKQMRQSKQAAQQGKRQQAKEQGEKAAEQLEQTEEQLEKERDSLEQEWKQDVLDALDQALAETSRLADRQLAMEEQLRRGPATASTRAEQAAIEEGTERLVQVVKEASGKNALVSPRIATALAAAKLQMSRGRDAVSTATPNQREAAERAGDAVDALNLAASQLVRARGSVGGSGSGSGLSEALEQMKKMAGQQGQIGQQSGGLLPQMGGGGMPQQLKALGAEQRKLAEQLERMRGRGDVPGAGEMADEAKDLARRLEAQRLDRETVERQEKLFRRMLDAGRTLQGHEEDDKKERQSTTASGTETSTPPALLRPRGADDAPRLPSWEELQRLTPGERRLVVDYFRRLSAGAP